MQMKSDSNLRAMETTQCAHTNHIRLRSSKDAHEGNCKHMTVAALFLVAKVGKAAY